MFTTPTPTATLAPRIDLSGFTLPNSISIPSGFSLTELSTYISIPTVINGITLPTGVVIHYTADPATLSESSSSSSPTSTPTTTPSSSSQSQTPSPSSTDAPSGSHSNTALLAGIFTAVALLALLLLLLTFWLLRRRRRRKQHDQDLAAAGAVPRGTVSRSRFWHMRGGDAASSRLSRSLNSASSEHLAESEMVFKPMEPSQGRGHDANQHLLSVDHRYPSDALMSPGSPLSFDRITHPDGSYFPTVYTPGPPNPEKRGLYGMNAAGIGAAAAFGAGAAALAAGHHRRQSSSVDPFADDPRQGRIGHSNSSSLSTTGDLGTDAPYVHRAGFGPSMPAAGTDDPSFVFGESFLSPTGHGTGRMLDRMPTAGGTHPPLSMPAPALMHMGSSFAAGTSSAPVPARFNTGNTYETTYESARTSLSGSSDIADESSFSHDNPGTSPIVAQRATGVRASDEIHRQSSGTQYGGWLSGGMGGVPEHNRGYGYEDEGESSGSWSAELSSSQMAELSAQRSPLPYPAPGYVSKASRSNPSSGSSPMESIPEGLPSADKGKEAKTPGAIEDQVDYRPARRLSVVNPTP